MDEIDELISTLPHAGTGRMDWRVAAKKAEALRAKGYGLTESYQILHKLGMPGIDGTPENQKSFVQAMSKRFNRKAKS